MNVLQQWFNTEINNMKFSGCQQEKHVNASWRCFMTDSLMDTLQVKDTYYHTDRVQCRGAVTTSRSQGPTSLELSVFCLDQLQQGDVLRPAVLSFIQSIDTLYA